MTKIAFSKLGVTKSDSVKTVKTNTGIDIEVRQYLPVGEKLELISKVINLAADENNFSNPIKLEVFGTLEIVFAYSGINFTDKQKEDPAKLYDLLETSGISDLVISAIPENEYQMVIKGITDSSSSIYTYRNSVLGILDIISKDYSQLDLDATQIQSKIANPENLSLLRDILGKMG